MPRRSRYVTDSPGEVAAIKDLLDNFLKKLNDKNLREQVRALIPVVHKVRDLGSSLMPRNGGVSGMDRIEKYLRIFPKTLIDGDELLVVSGIGEWARRTRQLRVEFGWWIYTGVTIKEIAEAEPEQIDALKAMLQIDPMTVKTDQYILIREEQDREAALRWNVANGIRKSDVSVKDKILLFFRKNVGKIVSGEELRYVAADKTEWARRSRELRTEDGWPVFTKMQGHAEIPVGGYLLDEDKQAAEHDRHIKDDVRVAVLARDGWKCTNCGWNRSMLAPDDPRKFLELHHIEEHGKGGANTAENLITLCNVDHDAVHRGDLRREGDTWTKS